ncbi:MAG: translation initiation factor IF-3 [Stappia sp.]|uniref:translation initiation factor IF-3 n=1 Tax=Stappia sp. TaxID=1870903 RepID=UPI000C482E2E|nr:translation initiation factor IF-3 [Stappia sp.]MAA98995.1 translation initiation factor IF-3 [Stappia sp.]MBM18413.1 translation initiation factor IF-3 [Stappia sp.]
MVDGGRLLGQAIRIVFALVFAFVAAGLFLAFGLFRALDPANDPVGVGATAGFALVSSSVIGGIAFVPALVGVAISELFALRGIVFHLAVGGAIGAAVWIAGGDGGSAQTGAAALTPGTSVAAAAGFVAGFMYWLFAGRQAGCWRVGRPPDAADRDAGPGH